MSVNKNELKRVLKVSRQVQDQLNESRFAVKPVVNDFTIPVSSWTLEDNKYIAVISSENLTADNYVEVFFDDSCSEIVSAANISTEGESFQGGILITAKNVPTDTISGSYYIFKGDSFVMKARVNTGNSTETTFVGATSITSGVAGNVPAPLAGDQNKFLCGNGQWAKIPSGSGSGSDNNFTDAYKAKLDSIEAGAQVNLLNGVAFTGAEYDFNTETKVASVTITGGDNFIINNNAVKSASITGAEIDFDAENKTANITISSGGEGAANFTVNGAEVGAMSVTGAASVNVEGNTAIVSITGADDFVLNGNTIKSANITGAEIDFDAETKAANITIQGGSASDFILNGETVKSASITGAAVEIDSLGAASIVLPDSIANVTVNGSAVKKLNFGGAIGVNIVSSLQAANISSTDYSGEIGSLGGQISTANSNIATLSTAYKQLDNRVTVLESQMPSHGYFGIAQTGTGNTLGSWSVII